MNNVNMANLNPMGGPVGAPVQMMNNGVVAPPGAARQLQASDSSRTLLNTYIYEYFLRYGMYDCARAILNSDQQVKVQKDSPSGRRDDNGNLVGNGLGDDAMDTDSKEDIDGNRPDDLPAPVVPTSLQDSCFLYEWFCMFWDIFNAQKGKGASGQVNQYVSHTQQQNRLRQAQQQDLLRQMRPDMAAQQQQFIMRQMPNGQMNMMNKGNQLQRAAMANNQNNPQMQMLAQQQKQGQMQRDPSDMDGNRQRGPGSPNSTDNAPSPSKRARLDAGPFPNQPGMMPNGRPAGQGMPGQQNLANSSPAVQAKSIQTYAQNLQQHHGSQMPNKAMGPNAGGPQGQGSPMVPQGPDNAINAYYNAGEMTGGPGGMRPNGPAGTQQGGSNHALQDYQMQLMLLEQQNKKRLMMARQEQDVGGGMQRPEGGPGGPGGPGAPPQAPNAQQFPGQGASPQGPRAGASPNPSEMKRAGQMNNAANMGSPLPEGAQNRESPNPMNFMGNQMDPNGAPHFFKPMNNMEGNMVANPQMNGMRPPSSHPGQPFNGQMNPQQQMIARQIQAQQAVQQQAGGGQPGGPPMQWQQGGPNGNQMGGPQGGPQAGPQVHGTPQQRAMPPPSAPAAAANSNANQRNQTASPQVSNAAPPTPSQGNKPAPKKKDSKAAKDKRAANQKKSNANVNAGATPAAEPPAEVEPPTPATPITPMATQSFNKQGQNPAAAAAAAAAAANLPNGAPPAAPPPAPAAVPPQQHADPNQNFINDGGLDFGNMDFANPLTSGDVLNDFDFDSFLHDNVDEGSGFDFNNGFGMEGTGEIGAD